MAPAAGAPLLLHTGCFWGASQWKTWAPPLPWNTTRRAGQWLVRWGSGWFLGLGEDGRSLPFPLQDLQPSAARLLSARLPVYTAVRFRTGSEAATLAEDTAGSWGAQLSQVLVGKEGKSLLPGPCHCSCPAHTHFFFFSCRVTALCGWGQCSVDNRFLRRASSVMFL